MNKYLDLLRCFNEHAVRYAIVGGFAVTIHGVPRLTLDLDIAVALEEKNLRLAINCLRKNGFSSRLPADPLRLLDESERRDWVENRNLIAFSFVCDDDPSAIVDFLITDDFVSSGLVERGQIAEFLGNPVVVCSLDDLIRIKERSPREKDLADAENLRALNGK